MRRWFPNRFVLALFTVKINDGERRFGFLFQKPGSAGEDVICTAASVVRTSLTSSHVIAFQVFLVNYFQLQFLIIFSPQFSLVIYFIHSSVYIGERNTTHSGILTWEIQWTEELGGVPSMGSQRVWYYRVSFSSYKKYLYVCVCVCMFTGIF